MNLVPNTFWDDFTIADVFGDSAIKDTYNRAFKEWKTDVKMFTALTANLNWKCWWWYDRGNEKRMELYRELFYNSRDFGYSKFKGEDFQYFWSVLD